MNLTIKDLSASTELDQAAMTAVCGGVGDQANGLSQANLMNMAVANNVGVGLVAAGPMTIQSTISNTQTGTNYADLYNNKGLSVGFPFFEVPFAI